jgi:hypothetical protein
VADDRGTGRYERKFLVEGLDPALPEHSVRLHPAGFSEIFRLRFVNNCYFDSPTLQLYRDAVEGATRRLKVRIRWYGDLFGEIERPVLELKGKHGLVGTKRSFPLPPTTLDRTSPLPPLHAWLAGADVPREVALAIGGLRPTLINRYSRRYFLSADRVFRMTIDRRCEYFSVHPPRGAVHAELGDDLMTILELKYGEAADDAAPAVANRLPFRMTKSSKYVTGLTRLGFR